MWCGVVVAWCLRKASWEEWNRIEESKELDQGIGLVYLDIICTSILLLLM